MKHLLTGLEYNAQKISDLLGVASDIADHPQDYQACLSGKVLAMLFEKPSMRTRFSFGIGMQRLGGSVMESVSTQQKSELPRDTMRVIQGYADAVMVRTGQDAILTEMASVACIPVINGLTDGHHPCQILSDLWTLQRHWGKLSGLKLAYVGDGNNILHSLVLLATQMDIEVHYACPRGHVPDANILKLCSDGALVHAHETPVSAVSGADVVYTDVWRSMGFGPIDQSDFDGYQVNEALMHQASADAVVMHCMPMNRGEEISDTLPDQACSLIFPQSHARMTMQQAILVSMLSDEIK